MSDTEDTSVFLTWQSQTRPGEAEVSQLLQETVKQYEEYMRLADLADISELPEASHPRHAWDNPIGLVVSD